MGFILTQIPDIFDEVVEFKNSIMRKKYPCPLKDCKAVLSRPGRLEDHMYTHTGELPYKCKVPGCTKEYHSRNSLRRHLQELHEGKATLYTTFLRCPHPTCMRLLRNRFNLHKHYQRLHTDQFKFMCQYCDKGFQKHTQLQCHVYHHTGIPPLRCPTCSAGFVTERDLKRHQRSHRNWECEVNGCGKVFLSWKTYRKHLSTDHSGVFQCDVCKKTFKTKNAVRLHVMCHLEVNSRSVLPCPYENCERFYFHKRNLKQHIQFWHEEKGFDCKECGQTLSTNAKLKQHMLIHTAKEQPMQAKKQTTTRKKRKDAGIPHQSMAAKLSGVIIPHEEEKVLLKNEYASTIEVDPCAKTGVDIYSTYLAAKQRAATKWKDKLDANGEKLKQEYTDNDDFKDVFASASTGNLQSTMSSSDCVYAVHNEVHKTSDIENGKESSDCDGDSFVLEQTSYLLNGKNDHTPKTEQEEVCGSDDLCKMKKEALDRTVAMDAFHGQNHKKEWHQVYNLKKWVLVMRGMMELLCPVVSSECPSRASTIP